MSTTVPTPLPVRINMNDPFDKALTSVSEQGHHSRCAFGNKWKVVAAESDDPGWQTAAAMRGQGALFMPERGVVRYRYGDQRFEQELSPADIAWLDKFDTDRSVRTRTITLDPMTAKPIGKTGSDKPSRAGRSRAENDANRGCNAHRAGNSGRAKRMRMLMKTRLNGDGTDAA